MWLLWLHQTQKSKRRGSIQPLKEIGQWCKGIYLIRWILQAAKIVLAHLRLPFIAIFDDLGAGRITQIVIVITI